MRFFFNGIKLKRDRYKFVLMYNKKKDILLFVI